MRAAHRGHRLSQAFNQCFAVKQQMDKKKKKISRVFSQA